MKCRIQSKCSYVPIALLTTAPSPSCWDLAASFLITVLGLSKTDTWFDSDMIFGTNGIAFLWRIFKSKGYRIEQKEAVPLNFSCEYVNDVGFWDTYIYIYIYIYRTWRQGCRFHAQLIQSAWDIESLNWICRREEI